MRKRLPIKKAASKLDHAGAGVEFTHPTLQTRVIIHRWPTASIAPWGEGSAYEEIKEHFLKLLKEIA